MLFYFSEEDEKPVSVQGKKAGVDTLKIVILNGCNYRFNEHRRIYILKEARKRGMEPAADRTPQAKKQKDVFVVSKTKWYLTASEEELASASDIVLDGTDGDRKHRILHHKLR